MKHQQPGVILMSNVKIETMQDIKKQYFPLAELEKANDAIELATGLVEESNGRAIFTFDPEKSFPDNYGISIAPIKQRNEVLKKTVVIGVCISAIPELDAIRCSKNGAAWIQNTLVDSLIAKVMNAVRPRKDGETAGLSPSMSMNSSHLIELKAY